MPFTLAHPAAILPLRGARQRTPPLLKGAITPHLRYFLPFNFGRFMPETHDFESSYTTSLMIGYLMLALIFLLQRPLSALLSPRAHWLFLHGLAPFRHGARDWLLAAFAIVVGVWSHLVWDSFTHTDSWVVHRVAALSAPVLIAGHTVPVCTLLQYISSALGLLALAVWYARLRTPPVVRHGPAAPRSAVRPLLLLIATAGLLIGGVQSADFYRHTHFIYRTLSILLTHSVAWFAALYLVAGIIVTLERHAEPQAEPR